MLHRAHLIGLSLAAVVALGAAPAAAQSPGPALQPAAAAQSPEPTAPASQPVDWRLQQAGRDPRSLELVAFGSSSCLPGTLSATVVETSRRIEITVASSSTADVCTADYGAHPLAAQLSAPVRGRAIVGPRRVRRDRLSLPPQAGRVSVPRVTGLAAADARAVVRLHGLRPRIERIADVRGLPRVAGQTPASGRTVSAGDDVMLFVTR